MALYSRRSTTRNSGYAQVEQIKRFAILLTTSRKTPAS
jgi:hypothetical protein